MHAHRLGIFPFLLMGAFASVACAVYPHTRFANKRQDEKLQDLRSSILRDIDITRMFNLDIKIVQNIKHCMRQADTTFIMMDNDQISCRKVQEIDSRLKNNANTFAFGVGRKLGERLEINRNQKYYHIGCCKTKDSADASILMLSMRLFCLHQNIVSDSRGEILFCVVSKDRVFEQMRHCFFFCKTLVVLESS